MTTPIILASASPRRAALLNQIGISFDVVVPDVDEQAMASETPENLVQRLAKEKAQWALEQTESLHPVLGADTLGVLDGRLLMKPRDKADAFSMLERMSGKTHQVLTAVMLIHQGKALSKLVKSHITFRPITKIEMEVYWASGEPQDKAGAYGIQGLGAQFVQHLNGSYSAVMGLPLYETCELLRRIGRHPLTGSNAV